MSSFARYHSELENAMKPFKGQTLKASQIKAIFSKAHPDCNVAWVSPSDHCHNHTCKGACHCSKTEGALFIRVAYGTYEVL